MVDKFCMSKSLCNSRSTFLKIVAKLPEQNVKGGKLSERHSQEREENHMKRVYNLHLIHLHDWAPRIWETKNFNFVIHRGIRVCWWNIKWFMCWKRRRELTRRQHLELIFSRFIIYRSSILTFGFPPSPFRERKKKRFVLAKEFNIL